MCVSLKFLSIVYLLTVSFSILYDPLMRMRASCLLPYRADPFMLMSSSPTFSFSHRAAFPPSSICGQRYRLVEIKEESWKANKATFRLKEREKSEG